MKKIKIWIIMFILLFVGMGVVHAEETNLENIKLTVEGITDNNQTYAYISIKDATFNEEHQFYYILTKDDSDIPNNISTSDFSKYLGGVIRLYDPGVSNVIYIQATEQWGNVYVTIYESEGGGNYTKKSSSILVERPTDLMLSKRIEAFLFKDESVFYLHGLNYGLIERKLNYKIGVVSDNSILNKIKNGDSIGLQELLDYSKKDSNIVKSGSRKATSNQEPIFSQTDIVEGKYYYVYLELDTEDGKYYPMEDISLYKALTDGQGELWLCDYTDDQFAWDDIEDKYQSYWEKFVKLFKESELTKAYLESANDSISIVDDENSLTITLTSEEGNYTTIFTYKNGIVSFELNKDANEGQELFDSLWSGVAIETFAKMFNYDIEQMANYLESRLDFVLDKDGIEFKIKNFNINEQTDITNINIDGQVFEYLKLDIVNGLKNFKPTESKPYADEPAAQVKTGVAIGLSIVSSLFILGISGYIIYIKINKKNKINKI